MTDEQRVERMIAFGDFRSQRFQDGMTAFLDRMNDMARICCFSASATNLHMWTHYAKEGRRLALEFRLPEDFVLPVRYVNKLPRFRAFNIKDNNLLPTLFFRKLRTFAAEREWRRVLYREQEHEFPFHTTWLTGIIFGYKCSDDDRHYTRELAKKGKLSVKFYEAIVSKGHSELIIRQIP
jgi:hypothetical protein